MRVVLMVHRFPELSESFIVNKFVGLVDRGLDMHISCRTVDEHAWKTFTQLRGREDLRLRVHQSFTLPPSAADVVRFIKQLVACVRRRPGPTFHYLRRALANGGWSDVKKFAVDAHLVMLAPDLIHFGFGTLAAERSYLSERLGCRTSVSFRGYDLNYAGVEDPDYYSSVWGRVSAVHCLSGDLWSKALRRGCPAELPHALIPPAIDLTRFSQSSGSLHPQGVERIRVLSVGRLHWAKGYEFGLQAIRLVVDRGIDLRYRIVGGGSFLEGIAYCRHQLGLDEVVELAGPLPQNQVIEELASADIFLHPSVSEGFGNAVIEAQAMGLPVVCSNAGGLPENVLDGVTGFVVPARDHRALAQRMEALASDSALRREMGNAGSVRVSERFALADQLRAFEDFFQAIGR